MRFIVVGCSYRTAPLVLRERLGFAEAELPSALGELRCSPDVAEGMIVSTCNRVEVWGTSARPTHARRGVRQLLCRLKGLSPHQLEVAIFEREDLEALGHIFRVTASLDAMVVGEAQITGQVKEAYAAASAACAVGPLLNRCMHRAFAAAKRVRHETGIARHPVSVSSVAAELALRVFGDLTSSTVLVIGAGEMAELAVRHLLGSGVGDVRVVNRTHERAVALAAQLGARAFPFEELRNQLLLADIVIASTGSSEPILGRRLLSAVLRQRKQRPLFIVDIAVPRDVERDAASLPNVYLFDVDDLEQVAAENLKERRREARAAEVILRQELESFADWLRQQDAVPVIKQLRQHFTDIVQAEVSRTAQALHLEAGRELQILDAMAEAIVNKLLHDPTIELKDHAAHVDGRFLARAARHLFHLPEASRLELENTPPSPAEPAPASTEPESASAEPVARRSNELAGLAASGPFLRKVNE